MARQHRRYTKEELVVAVNDSVSYTEVLRKLGRSPVGGNSTNLALLLKRWEIDTSHFTGQCHARGKPSSKRRPADEMLVMGTPLDRRVEARRLRWCLAEKGVEYRCNICGINEWLGEQLRLEVDHINEQYWDNRLENLQFLCPNCHTMKK